MGNATQVDKIGRRQMRAAIVAVALLIALLIVDNFRWELLRLSHHNAAHNAVFNLGIYPLLMSTAFVISAFVVGGVLGNWTRITRPRNKFIPLLLTLPIIALAFVFILDK